MVLEAVDIVDVIGGRVHLQRKGKEFVGLCPFHPDHTPSMSVSPKKRIFKCFSCGAGGDVIHFVQKLNRLDFREALFSLAERAGISVHVSADDDRLRQSRSAVHACIAWAVEHFRRNLNSTDAGRRALAYASSRGLTPETIERFSLGLAADAWDDLSSAASRAGLQTSTLLQAGLVATNDSGKTYDRFRDRLVFPIKDATGRPIAFGGRTLRDDPAKYLNSPDTVLFSKSRILYGLDRARAAIEREGAAIVVEGYMDCVLLSQYGFANTVATLGTALTDAHAKLLGPLATTVYLCFDSDQAGVRAADRAVEVALRTRAEVRVVLLESDKDPADCVLKSGADGFRGQLTRAVDALQFKWSQTLKSFGSAGQSGRRAAVETYIQFVAEASAHGGLDPLEQDLLVGRLSELLAIPPEEVFRLLTSARRPVVRRQTTDAKELSASDRSAYDAATRGLPPGLVISTETVLGLLIGNPGCWSDVGETVARAAGLSETWERVYRVLLEVHHDLGEYSLGDVLARCDESDECELVARATEHARGASDYREAFRAARERVASELEILQMVDLRGDLRASRGTGPPDDTVYRSFWEIARKQHSVLPADRRWIATVR